MLLLDVTINNTLSFIPTEAQVSTFDALVQLGFPEGLTEV